MTQPPATWQRNSPRPPALSFTQQPELKRLFEAVLDTNREITIFCGAGVSVDSGLPTWRELIKNLAERIENDKVREVILADELSLSRKVDLILRLVKRSRQEESVISEALYAGALGGLSSGQLATAIARLAVAIQGRVRLVTTNYDDRLEAALEAVAPNSTVTPVAIDNFATHQRTLDLGELGNLRFQVEHLHGFLSSDGRQIGPIVLSESSYLARGREAQGFIKALLESSTVLFVGVSMTDPSIIGPLYDLRNEPISAFAILPRSYEMTSEDDKSGALAHSYLCMQADYLASLNVMPILLKSYAQIAQCMLELAIACDNPTAYMSDDPATSLRYGHRFKRVLCRLHSVIQAAPSGNEGPSGEAAYRLSNLLHEKFHAVNGPAHFIRRALDHTIDDFEDLGVERYFLEQEYFGTFLWLRSLRDVGLPPYELFMASSSVYVHRESRTVHKRTGVWPGASYLAAKCVYLGRVRTEYLPLDAEYKGGTVTWRSFFGTPLTYTENQITPGSDGKHPVTVGAVVLHSNRRAVERRQLEEAARAQEVEVKKGITTGRSVETIFHPSVTSLMSASDKETLMDLIARSVRLAISELLERGSSLPPSG